MRAEHIRQAARLYGDSEGFRNAMLEAGLPIEETPIADGEIHRFGPKKTCYYVYFGDGGAFGDWKSGYKATWTTGRRTDADELARLTEACKAQQRKREATYQEAKARAQQLWRDAYPATDHQYLTIKGVHSYGLRILGNQLLIPVTTRKEIQSLQFINPDGSKLFLKGGKASGGYFAIGKLGDCIWICEGYATAASVHEATGQATAAAFNAGNLPTITSQLKRAMPHIRVYIGADNDPVGISKAEAAIKWGAAGMIAPDPEQGISDWNDYHQRHGIDATREALAEVAA